MNEKESSNLETTSSAAQPGGPAAMRRRGLGSFFKNPLVIVIVLLVLGGGGFFGYRYWQDTQSRVYIENASIDAPTISISPAIPGVLNTIYVKQGDSIYTGQHLFNVGDHITSAVTPGVVTSIQDTPGQMVSSASPVVQLYNPEALRVVGQVQEDQGLKYIHVGQRVVFTVDAFGSKQFQGVVESIANIPEQSNIIFSISDKRQEKLYDVKVAFELSAYPELLNGMSAKMWIYK